MSIPNLSGELIDDYLQDETQKRNKVGSLKSFEKAYLQNEGRTFVRDGFNADEENIADLFQIDENDAGDEFYDEDEDDDEN